MLESDRVLRIIIGPVLLALWLALGAYLVDDVWQKRPSVETVTEWSSALGTVAAAGVVVIVVGYAMSLMTLFFISWLKWDLELPSDEEEFELMRKALGVTEEDTKSSPLSKRTNKLATVVLYQGRQWDQSPFKWAERRWLNIGISANGITAILLAWLLWLHFFGPNVSIWWAGWSVFLIALFVWHICMNYRAMKAMHWLASRLPKKLDGQGDKNDTS